MLHLLMLDKYRTPEFSNNVSLDIIAKFIERYAYEIDIIMVFLQNLIISQIVAIDSLTKLSIQ